MTTHSELLLGTVPTGPKQEIRITERVHNGRRVISIRAWYRAANDEWRPGREGIELRPEVLAEVLQTAEKTGTLPSLTR